MAFRYHILPESFEINGAPVPWIHELCYLRMFLDSRLTFAPYISIRSSMRFRTYVMRALVGI